MFKIISFGLLFYFLLQIYNYYKINTTAYLDEEQRKVDKDEAQNSLFLRGFICVIIFSMVYSMEAIRLKNRNKDRVKSSAYAISRATDLMSSEQDEFYNCMLDTLNTMYDGPSKVDLTSYDYNEAYLISADAAIFCIEWREEHGSF